MVDDWHNHIEDYSGRSLQRNIEEALKALLKQCQPPPHVNVIRKHFKSKRIS